MCGKLRVQIRSRLLTETQAFQPDNDHRLGQGGSQQLNSSSRSSAEGDGDFEVLWEDSDRVFSRKWCQGADGERTVVLAVLPASEHPSPATLDRLAHEYGLRDELDGAWAVRPLDLVHERGRTILVLEDPGGEPLHRLLGAPMKMASFLRLAISIAAPLGKLHRRGLVHKDLKPANILVNRASGEVWLTGFGIASRLPRERQAPEPPETIAGTLAYMAPEQTGRMNRSIDCRSDLYALGVTLYQMLTGALPFTAADPMEWVHCHVARKPMPPSERLTSIPKPVSAIVMKLLAKTAEERYQTAAGVESDLRRCLADWETKRRIDDFPVGERDMPDRLLIPEKLYGRAREIEILLASFDRVVAGRGPEFVLVSGYSGIGKSSVVNELHKSLVPPRGFFATGKFDQYKRDIPYATLAQAFQSLIRPLLGKSEAELRIWRDAIQDALGPNALLIVDLIPELKLIIGEQPPVPVLPPQDAQRRFQLVFRRFISVFARPQHPLALFLDDLQWLDAATLDLLENLLAQPDARHLTLIGAYRDNELDSAHPLMRKLEAIRKAGAAVQEIALAPLSREDLGRLIADSLRCEPERADSLAQLVHEKTAGNPFFAIQFLYSLAEEGLLNFDHHEARWCWDLKQIHAKGYTDNVVDLMVGKLSRLPIETQKVLRQLACLGNSADLALLTMSYESSEDEILSDLREAVSAGLVLYSEGTYRFLHDRVHEAAYLLIPEHLRDQTHLRIGRLLAARTPPEKREEMIFEIVGQLNRGADLIISAAEREQVAELNLIAGQRAKQSTAYTSALTYLAAGRALLPEDCWERCGALTFALELHRAECEFLTGALGEADERLAGLARRDVGLPDLAAVARLQVELFTTLGRTYRAIEVCLDYLRHVGVEWSAHPTKEEVRQEYERLWREIGRRSIEDLVDLPLMSDPGWRATMDVLTAVASTALFTDENLPCLVICRMANLSLEHGNSDGSCYAYAWLGVILGPYFGEYRAAFRFGKLGLDLMEQRGLRRFQARVYLIFGHRVIPWTQPIRAGRPFVRRAFDAANKFGDLTFAAYSCDNLTTSLLATGDPLSDVQREAEAGLGFARQARFGLASDLTTPQLRLIRTLRGLTPEFGFFNDTDFDERRFEQHLEEDPRLATAACRYWNRKLQARFFAGAYASAIAAAANAERLLWTSPYFFELAEYHLYAALTRAALCDTAPACECTKHLEALGAHCRQLQEWVGTCAENFEGRAALVAAELARLEGREFEAERLYEQAIRSAHANGLVHTEALANELAARFYVAHGFEKIAVTYLRDARYCYLRWGADGKVRQLDEIYPQLGKEQPAPGPTSTIGTSVEQLDLATVIKLSQAVSGTIVRERLLVTVMRAAIEHAGAEHGLLILWRGAEPRIVAEASIDGNTVAVQLCDDPVTAATLPETILHYVLHTRESVILDDAAARNPFSADPYIQARQARSILGLPLTTQANLIGMLYLENNLATRTFAPGRIAILKLLASQASTALENTRLYRDLAEREAKIRRLVDANIIGIFIFDFEGRIIEANDAFLRIAGYDRDDLVSGRVRWTDLTPPEWRDRHARAWAELEMAGTVQPYEREYFRKDGSRAPALIGSARIDEGANEGVAFVLDLTERRRAAEALREAQMELAHATRVATMGQLTASIAHEVNQPVAAVVIGAEAALRWLRARPPNLEEVRQALARIVNDGTRAGDVIARIRELVKKAPPRKDSVDINEAICEVIELTHSEALKNGVSVRTELADGLPLIEGDRVQLQQVVLNLIVNAVQAMGAVRDGVRDLLVTTAQAEPNGVLVAVMDSGPGLAPGTVERIFDPFYSTKPGGLGMGLSICRSIVEAHDGRLWVTAKQARGVIFHFMVPICSAS
jgi:PAS domain S-box-containing protein